MRRKPFRIFFSLLAALLIAASFTGCGPKSDYEGGGEANPPPVVPPPSDVTDMTGKNAAQQEAETDYRLFYLPESGRVGDPMPYSDGETVSVYYLKDEGGSVRHSVYCAATDNLTAYRDCGETLRSGDGGQDDYWIGTGSVVRAGEDYYLFYTAHNPNLYPAEKIAVAVSRGDAAHFEKTDFRIAPPASLSQSDFRDPQAFYDPASKKFDIIATSNSGGIAHIVRFSVSLDLTQATYEGIVFSYQGFWNLECPDIFRLGDRYYLTYSAQNDTMWYASSKNKFSGYGMPARLEGKLFYAAKSFVRGGETYLAGWVARRASPDNGAAAAWGGNLAVHRVIAQADGDLRLEPIKELTDYYASPVALGSGEIVLDGEESRAAATLYESYSLEGTLSFGGTEAFGLAFGQSGVQLRFEPATHKIVFTTDGGKTEAASVTARLMPGAAYPFRFVAEGSVGILYFGESALSVRMYGQNSGSVALFSEGSAVSAKNLKQYLRSETRG